MVSEFKQPQKPQESPFNEETRLSPEKYQEILKSACIVLRHHNTFLQEFKTDRSPWLEALREIMDGRGNFAELLKSKREYWSDIARKVDYSGKTSLEALLEENDFTNEKISSLDEFNFFSYLHQISQDSLEDQQRFAKDLLNELEGN